ncbi:MAG: ABC transporter permease [Oscillospiraceae bacterium]|nr:ABC transporter permease [Oscillospiraceae bacterium]
MKNKKRKALSAVEYIWLLIVVIAVWQIASNLGLLNPLTLPSPAMILNTFISLIKKGTLQKNLLISSRRVLTGYAIAAASAIVLGILMGLSTHFKRMTDLIIQILKPIPPISWIPLVILWFGIGEKGKVFLIFIGCFFTILVNVVDGIRRIDVKLIELSNSMVIPKLKYVFKVVIPYAAPNIFTGLRVGLGQSWMCVVAAELVASSTGLGYMIMYARQFGQTDVVIVGMLMIGIIGKVMDSILMLIEKRVIRWK